MEKEELEQRLELFLRQEPVSDTRVRASGTGRFRVEITFLPNCTINERFFELLESAVGREIGELSGFRLSGNAIVIRFSVPSRNDPNGESDRIKELAICVWKTGRAKECGEAELADMTI